MHVFWLNVVWAITIVIFYVGFIGAMVTYKDVFLDMTLGGLIGMICINIILCYVDDEPVEVTDDYIQMTDVKIENVFLF